MTDRKLTRAALVRSTSFDPEAYTVDVVWSTGAPVDRMDWRTGDLYREVLSLAPGAVRLDRLNAGASFLDTHDSGALASVIGSVVPGSASVDGERGVVTVVLSRADADRDTVGKIRDGVIRNISVGYVTHAYDETTEDGVTTRTATDWEPLEISAVPVPADAGAQIRSHQPGGRASGRLASKDFWQGVMARQGIGARKTPTALSGLTPDQQRDAERGAAHARKLLGKR